MALYCIQLPSSLQYETHFSWQLNCWSLRCSWSIAYRCCSNYIFILHSILGCNILRKDNCQPRRETFHFWDLVRLILEILRYIEIYHVSRPFYGKHFANPIEHVEQDPDSTSIWNGYGWMDLEYEVIYKLLLWHYSIPVSATGLCRHYNVPVLVRPRQPVL